MLTILFFHQPVDATTTKLYCFDLRNDIADGRTTVEETVAFQLAVAAEDQALLERSVESRPARPPARGAHPGRPHHARDAPHPPRPRRRRRRRPRVTTRSSPPRRTRAAMGRPRSSALLRGRSRCGSSAGERGGPSGMVVTPAEAIRPIVGSTRDVYLRATVATVSRRCAAAHRRDAGFRRRAGPPTVPPLRRAISRAALANAAPWVAVAPCLLVVLGRDRGPAAVAAIAVFFFVFVVATVGLSAPPRRAHDVVTPSAARGRSGADSAAPGVLAVAARRAPARGTRGARRRDLRRVVRRRAWPRRLLLRHAERPRRTAVGGVAAHAACGLVAFALFALVIRTLVRQIRGLGRAGRRDDPRRASRRAHRAARAATAIGPRRRARRRLVGLDRDRRHLAAGGPPAVAGWQDLIDTPGDYLGGGRHVAHRGHRPRHRRRRRRPRRRARRRGPGSSPAPSCRSSS